MYPSRAEAMPSGGPAMSSSHSPFCLAHTAPQRRQPCHIVKASSEDSSSAAVPPQAQPDAAQPPPWAPAAPPQAPAAQSMPVFFPFASPPSRPPRYVQTQRGVPNFSAPISEDPCPECAGTGKTTCGACRGKGRLNYRSAAMLPKGVHYEWCPHCRASGRWVCSPCMGTGRRRDPIGFRVE